MTELKEELKVGPDEGAVEYAERAEAALERHYRQTGERLSAWGTMPGEGPVGILKRMKVLKEADNIRAAGRARKTEGRRRAEKTDASQERKGGMEEVSTHQRYRAKSQERDTERAVSEFETAKKRLYRSDGTKVYGEEEHAERLGKLTADLREKTEAVVREAHEHA
jgi:hypothetical protein